MIGRPIPRATYRLQMTKEFPFAAAAEIASYLSRLGVSHAYLSPILKARRGSTHGYDVVDHTVLNPELGTRADFERMVEAFRRNGLGIVLDIVPNHMGVGGDENALWLDLLEHGRDSGYADWFDIDWSPPDPTLQNKILVPFLGRSFEEALDGGGLELRYDPGEQTFAVWAEGTHKLPIAPETYGMIGGPSAVGRLNSSAGRGEFVKLIAAQHWRAARYSVAADDINYRRFFIVSDLAGIRVERDEVFDHVHKLTFELVREGFIDGLRVDHIDGLYDPRGYCLKLRRECPRDVYLIVEKILAPHEALRADWQVDGTTGYEFASLTTRLLVDPRGEEALTKAYWELSGNHTPFDEIEKAAKRTIIDVEMAAELDAQVRRLRALAASALRTADITANAIRRALSATIAAMRVYRTYVDEPFSDKDKRNIAVAIAEARRTAPQIDAAVFEFLGEVMTGELCRRHKQYDAAAARDAAKRIQQYTGPVMAKGLEDTALYRANRLLALADVGARPDRFTGTIAAFHDFNRARHESTPHGMLAGTTHDSKRGEDTRARIATISGDASEWTAAVAEWRRLLDQAGAPAIARDDAYVFFQLLLGAWPADWGPGTMPEAEGLQTFRARIEGAMIKSIREARLRSNWTSPNAEYEQAITAFVDTAIGADSFLAAFGTYEDRIGEWGARSGLVATVLRLTAPGVPDIYQGAELWQQSMVDPDNRRPVDYSRGESLLSESEGQPAAALMAHWRDGAVKQHVIVSLLALRGGKPELFAAGTYEPLATPPDSDVCAFLRRDGNDAIVVTTELYPWRTHPRSGALTLPRELAARRWISLWDEVAPQDFVLAQLFAELPVAVLIAED
jgi:(1->4)-alpha-D-glucan 1-alpha-D-glucosylmutase